MWRTDCLETQMEVQTEQEVEVDDGGFDQGGRHGGNLN